MGFDRLNILTTHTINQEELKEEYLEKGSFIHFKTGLQNLTNEKIHDYKMKELEEQEYSSKPHPRRSSTRREIE